MKMYLISDNIDTYTGMRLVGIEGCVVHEKQELKEAMERAIADSIHWRSITDRKIWKGFSRSRNPAQNGHQGTDHHRGARPARYWPQAGFYYFLRK